MVWVVLTGMPKCVMHTQNRWKYFHSKCTQFRTDDVFLVVVPSPFGFGLWMGHFSPTMLGATTVLMQEFDVDATLAAIERHRVTVLAAVTTQVLMMLASPHLATTDVSSLRMVFSTGAPWPVWLKEAWIEWLGPHVIREGYGGTESLWNK